MPSRAQWDKLSPRYRQRLINAGYTRKDYLANKPRQFARGHAKTPERPTRAGRNPERYPEYLAKRRKTGGGRLPVITDDRRWKLIQRMTYELLQAIMTRGNTIRTSHGRNHQITRMDALTLENNILNASVPLFLYMETLNAEQWRENASIPYEGDWQQQDDASVNPFFYH